MSVIRLLFVCSALNTGGAERQLRVLAAGLAQMGFSPRVVTLTGRGRFFEELADEGVEIDCLEMRNRFDFVRARAIWEATEERPHVVITQETNAHVLGHFVARKLGVAHVLVDHTPPGLPRSRHRVLLGRLVARRAALVVAVSPGQLEDFRAVGYPPERTVVIENGVWPLGGTSSSAVVRASLGLSDSFVALMVANLRPQKRARHFVQAVSRAREIEPSVRGLIAGVGPDFDEVRDLAAHLGGAVTMLGERADVADLMRAADVVCLTSSTEGLPLVLLEAMSAARAVVATDVPGIREAVVNGETGILVEKQDVAAFADALVQCARNPDVVKTMGASAEKHFERAFSAERMVSAYAEVLGRLARPT